MMLGFNHGPKNVFLPMYLNASCYRIDEEVSSLRKKLDTTTTPLKPSTEGHDKVSEETKLETIEVRMVVIIIFWCASWYKYHCAKEMSNTIK